MGELEPISPTGPLLKVARDPELNILRGRDRLIVEAGDTLIRVDTAKKPGKPWEQKLRDDIETARASYHAEWGNVPIWDCFDHRESTFNYIAYIQYSSPEGVVTAEALSNRMVLEKPEDLTFYHLNGVPLDKALEQLLYRQRGYEPRVIAGESRIGAMRPPNQKSNVRTMEAFAAIKLKMVEDAREMGVEHIACQLKHEMPLTIFTLNGVSYEFPPTEDLLNLPRGSVRLNRKHTEVIKHILNFPGYFLNAEGVCKVIRDLCEEGVGETEFFNNYTGLTCIKDLQRPRNIKQLAPLMQLDNQVGGTLRRRLLKEVGDGTYSSMSHVDEIEARAIDVLQKLARFESSSREVIA